MKVCVPTSGDGGMSEMSGAHIGKAPYWTLIDLESEVVKVVPNTGKHHGGTEHPVAILARLGIDAVAGADTCPGARAKLSEADIVLYSGGTGTVEDVVEELRAGRLEPVVHTEQPGAVTHCSHG